MPVASSHRRRTREENSDDDEQQQQQQTATTRRAYVMPGAGDISKLTLRDDLPIVPPLDGEVQIAVKAIGLNFADVFSCLGLYSATPVGEFVPGLEVSGVVISSKARKFKPGDTVFSFTRFGGYCTVINCREEYVRHLPQGYDFADGAALLGQALTAWYGLDTLGGLRTAVDRAKRANNKKVRVLIHSGAGGTGLWAVRLAQIVGGSHVHIVATVTGQSKVALLTQKASRGGLLDAPLPPHQVIDRSAGDTSPAEAIKAALAGSDGALTTEAGFDIVLDSLLGCEWFLPVWETLRPMGRHVVLGAGSMTPASDRLGVTGWVKLGIQYLRRPLVDPLASISRNVNLMCFNLIWLTEQTSEMNTLVDELLATLSNNNNNKAKMMQKPVIGHRFAFDDLPSAVRTFQSGATHGKVIVEIE